jgi:hypothetical protein
MSIVSLFISGVIVRFDSTLELLLSGLIIGVNDVNEQSDVGRDWRSAISNKYSFYSFLIDIYLPEGDKCEGVEQALPARDCFNDEILADNCLWNWDLRIDASFTFFFK